MGHDEAAPSLGRDRDRRGAGRAARDGGGAVRAAGPRLILLPGSVAAGPFPEVVLFGFDDWAFPFRNHVETRLSPAQNPRLVLRPGPPGSYDEAILYYGTVIRIGGTFRLWYNGNHGPERALAGFEREKCCLCTATSADGVHWEKPDLGLVEFNGSRKNNIVDFPVPNLWSTCAMLYEPSDPDPARRFKMAYEAQYEEGLRYRFSVAFSPDGLHWHPSALTPYDMFLEMSGITKWGGLYYVSGQGAMTAHHRTAARRLCTFVSSDFEHWSPCAAVGLDRAPDTTGPSGDDQIHPFEEVHLGAALWNRGNVLLGLYGQWHGDRSGDRHLLTMDLGLAVSHDALHYVEPIPNFRIVPAREQPEGPLGVGPALAQGQGMENVARQTLYWYSLWRGNKGSGVRLVTWPRDRLGGLQPFDPDRAQAVSCPVEALNGKARVFVSDVDGLGPNAGAAGWTVDEGFPPRPRLQRTDAQFLSENGFRVRSRGRSGPLAAARRRSGPDIRFDGVRPEIRQADAVYIEIDN